MNNKGLRVFLLSLLCCLATHSLLPAVSATGETASPLDYQGASLAYETVSRLEIAQQVAPTPPSPSPLSLEQQAQQLYETGRYLEAIRLLESYSLSSTKSDNPLTNARVLRNLALVYYQAGQIEQANQTLAKSLQLICQGETTCQSAPESSQLLGQILELKGQLEQGAGQSEAALETWQQAINNYQKVNDVTGVLRSQINRSQALRSLGFYRKAIQTLTQLQADLQSLPNTPLKVQGLQSLGDALRLGGDFKQSRQVLEESLALAQNSDDRELTASVFLSLGNTAQVQKQSVTALNFYQKAELNSSVPALKIQALLNQLRLLVEDKQWNQAESLLPKIQGNLQELSVSKLSVKSRINFAGSLKKMSGSVTNVSMAEPAQLLADAIQQSKQLENTKLLSYALGNLGELYEQNQQPQEAKIVTEQALLLAQETNASDIAYKWQWQLGRILKKQGKESDAKVAYEAAVNTLKSLRSDLVAINSETQFEFRDSVEPVYRQYVDLLLQDSPSQAEIKQARDTIEALQLAELDNFFQDACLDSQPVQVDQLDSNSAVFYTIVLPNSLDVIVALPGEPLRHYRSSVSQAEVEKTTSAMLTSLTIAKKRVLIENFLKPARQLYQWILEPVEADLQVSGVQNLVFVLDGVLRNIPIASLYDGQQYLAQKYSTALAPSLQLVDAQPLLRKLLKVFAGGLTEARQGFSPLPGVKTEIDQIQAEVATTELLNENFTTAQFEKQVNSEPFRVVHLATHGEFSSNAEDTFILTWDDRINAKELDNLLRNEQRFKRPIELLVLSACRTASGDNRAALGLAGVAVRAGARATVASLWYVDDEATTLLMSHFYQELAQNKNVTKAEALRRAQQTVLDVKKFSHPYFWSAFVMVGNWL